MVTNEWEGGFVADLTVTNLSPSVTSWTMDWFFGDTNPQITSMWNVGTWGQSGQEVSATNAPWNGTVDFIDSVTIGFVANGEVPDPPFLAFDFAGFDCMGENEIVMGDPVFPIWTDESAPTCLVAGPDQTVGVGACGSALPFAWFDGILKTEDGLCMEDTIGPPQLWPCSGSFPQRWARTGDGVLYTGTETTGYSCLVLDEGVLDSIPTPTLDVCAAWNQGGPPSPPPPTACEADVVAVSSWPGGFVGEATWTWNGPAIDEWQGGWTFTNGEQAANFWNGIGSQSGADVTVVNAPWNGSLEPGDSVTTGFIGVGTLADVANLSFNGVACNAPDPGEVVAAFDLLTPDVDLVDWALDEGFMNPTDCIDNDVWAYGGVSFQSWDAGEGCTTAMGVEWAGYYSRQIVYTGLDVRVFDGLSMAWDDGIDGFSVAGDGTWTRDRFFGGPYSGAW
ncbi:MAG: hypothetical protein GY882_04225, partial [Actinomycetia bacterium]|nr:hypothetical protein [Actinomycetes bacterium]